jgi:hypothetical protein
MTEQKKLLRPGVQDLSLATTPLMLEKTKKRNNVLVGNDPTQIRFVEHLLSATFQTEVKCQDVDLVNDDLLIGHEEPLLYRIDRLSMLEVAPTTRAKIGVWSLDLLEGSGEGLNAIVRYAAKLLGLEKPPKERVDQISRTLAKEDIDDINATLWRAAWLLHEELPSWRDWPKPWKNYLSWLPYGVDPKLRLNTLYWELRFYVFSVDGDEDSARKQGKPFNPTQFKDLKALKLPLRAVRSTLAELSIWRERKYDPYVCALRIAQIWENPV